MMMNLSHLEDCLVVPVRVDLAELGSNPVVLPHEESVDHGQDSLLINPGVASQETVNIFA